MSIRGQILASLGIMFLLSCIMFVATWSITSSQKTEGLVINLAGRQRMQIQKIAKDTLAYAHRVKAGNASPELAGAIRERLTAFGTVQSLLANGGEFRNGKSFTIPRPSATATRLLAEATRLNGQFAGEVETILAHGDGATASRLVAASEEVVTAQDKAVSQLQQESESSVTTLMIVQAAGMALSAAVLALVLLLMRKTLVRPLDRLREFAKAVAGGDLDAQAAGAYPLELGYLRDALTRMVASLRQNMDTARQKGIEAERHAAEADKALAEARKQEQRTQELLTRLNGAAAKARDVSESVMRESSQLVAQTEHVAHGAEHQRDRMVETATSMEEMNATVLEVARNAASAAASADEAKQKALIGAEGVRSAVNSIETIRQRILELRESMTRLGQQADNIGHIMNVISDIADQTNLLALNAAIEAARAGDAGRGFAVVADEVRKLAEKTMAATKEVGDAVVSIQGQARENIAAVESAASGIEESTQAAASSGRFMDEIVGIVGETATQVESIATASEEQSATSDEINRAVDEVNRIANETAEGMNVATAALSALTALAGELDEVIRQMTGDAPGAATSRVAKPRAVTAPSRKPLPAVRPKPAKALPVASKKPAAPKAAAKPAPKPLAAPSHAASAAKAVSGSAGNAILQWDQSLAVGIGDIDGQHQKLVQMICDLHEAMRSGQGKSQVEAIVRELEEYAVEHFGFEEKLMEQHKYPGYLNHRKEHDKFVDKVIAFGNDFRANKVALTNEVMEFLKNWLVGHIKGTDQKYSSFFHDKGVY